MQFQSSDIKAMDPRRRAAFMNSVSGFKSANLVGTVNAKGQTNLAIMSSAVHLGSSPPLLALIIRPSSDEHQTLANILESGCCSLNHVTSSIVEQGHQTAARYPEDMSEFDATGLSPVWHAGFGAPMVAAMDCIRNIWGRCWLRCRFCRAATLDSIGDDREPRSYGHNSGAQTAA